MAASKNKTAVFTVIYPGCEKFLPDFFSSLFSQSFQDYDLIIVNDNFKNWEKINKGFHENRIKFLEGANSVAGNRDKGIKYAIEQSYEKLIFADVDDLFSNNRVQSNVELLEKHPIIVNEISLINHSGSIIFENYFSKRISCNTKLFPSFLFDKNIAGMSNSAIRCDCINSEIKFPVDLIALDWYFFSQLLLKGNYIFFTCDSQTFYRQHDANTIGFKNITAERVKQIINVKKLHYKQLSKLNKLFLPYLDYFSELADKIFDDTFQNEIVRKIKEVNLSNPFWWEEVKYQN